MSAYTVNKVCWLVDNDANFRLALKVHPDQALQKFVPPLNDVERSAFLNGDVAALCAMGASRYLLARIASHRLFGLDRQSYFDRLKAAYDADPEGRTDIARS